MLFVNLWNTVPTPTLRFGLPVTMVMTRLTNNDNDDHLEDVDDLDALSYDGCVCWSVVIGEWSELSTRNMSFPHILPLFWFFPLNFYWAATFLDVGKLWWCTRNRYFLDTLPHFWLLETQFVSLSGATTYSPFATQGQAALKNENLKMKSFKIENIKMKSRFWKGKKSRVGNIMMKSLFWKVSKSRVENIKMKSLFLKSFSRVKNIKMKSLKIKSREYKDEKSQNQESRV